MCIIKTCTFRNWGFCKHGRLEEWVSITRAIRKFLAWKTRTFRKSWFYEVQTFLELGFENSGLEECGCFKNPNFMKVPQYILAVLQVWVQVQKKTDKEIVWKLFFLIRLGDGQVPFKNAGNRLNWVSSCLTDLSSALRMCWGQFSTYLNVLRLYLTMDKCHVTKSLYASKVCTHRSPNLCRKPFSQRTMWPC